MTQTRRTRHQDPEEGSSHGFQRAMAWTQPGRAVGSGPCRSMKQCGQVHPSWTAKGEQPVPDNMICPGSSRWCDDKNYRKSRQRCLTSPCRGRLYLSGRGSENDEVKFADITRKDGRYQPDRNLERTGEEVMTIYAESRQDAPPYEQRGKCRETTGKLDRGIRLCGDQRRKSAGS